jgi:Amt family ammonium transporter
MSAIAIGLIVGVVCFWMVAKVKGALGYDDSLDAFGVHGVGGTIGALLTGVFATSTINAVYADPEGNPLPVGLIEGNFMQLINQAGGVLIGWVIAIVGTYIILKVLDATIGLRVSGEEEIQGLDLNQHGEEGYNM